MLGVRVWRWCVNLIIVGYLVRPLSSGCVVGVLVFGGDCAVSFSVVTSVSAFVMLSGSVVWVVI